MAEQERDHMVSEVMTEAPRTVTGDTTFVDAARIMRDDDMGSVLVTGEGGKVVGLVTDRDLVVRGIAEEKDPHSTKVKEACSADLVTVSADTPAKEAVRLMREHAVRRLPVVDADGRAEGVIALGDLAVTRDPESALGDISAAAPNT